MKTIIFDLETSSLYANFGILLCGCTMEYPTGKIKTFRADKYPEWKESRTNSKPVVIDLLRELEDADILVAHNGQYFDKQWLNTLCLKYKLPPVVRWKKFIDPVLLARRHLRLGKNGLASILDYYEIPVDKTPVESKYWMEAILEGKRKAMDYIVHHCQQDVKALLPVYDKFRVLVENIDKQGSAR